MADVVLSQAQSYQKKLKESWTGRFFASIFPQTLTMSPGLDNLLPQLFPQHLAAGHLDLKDFALKAMPLERLQQCGGHAACVST